MCVLSEADADYARAVRVMAAMWEKCEILIACGKRALFGAGLVALLRLTASLPRACDRFHAPRYKCI